MRRIVDSMGGRRTGRAAEQKQNLEIIMPGTRGVTYAKLLILVTTLACLMPSGIAVLAQTMHNHATPAPALTQPGQAAFAAIQEVVEALERDPNTDWAKVNIEALRQHLIDMDNVTMRSEVKSEAIKGGMLFKVIGTGPIKDSIHRMVLAHARAMDGVGNWKFKAATFEDGASLAVLPPAEDLPKLKALGFIGVMTRGLHHQEHHLALARGGHPHR